MLADVIGAFLESLPTVAAAIEAAVRSGQANALERAAHTLKGELLAIGAISAAESVRQLEMFGRENDLSDANAVFAELQQQLAAVREPLVAFCQKFQSP